MTKVFLGEELETYVPRDPVPQPATSQLPNPGHVELHAVTEEHHNAMLATGSDDRELSAGWMTADTNGYLTRCGGCRELQLKSSSTITTPQIVDSDSTPL